MKATGHQHIHHGDKLIPAAKILRMDLASDLIARTIRSEDVTDGIRFIDLASQNAILGIDQDGKLTAIPLSAGETLVGRAGKLPIGQKIVSPTYDDAHRQDSPPSPDALPIPKQHHQLSSSPPPSLPISIPFEYMPKRRETKDIVAIQQEFLPIKPSSAPSILTKSDTLSRVIPLEVVKHKRRLPHAMHITATPGSTSLTNTGFPCTFEEFGALMVDDDQQSDAAYVTMKPVRFTFGKLAQRPDKAGILSSTFFVSRFGWFPEFECVVKLGKIIQKPKHEKKGKSHIPSFRIWIALSDSDLSLIDAPSIHQLIGFRYATALDMGSGTWKAISCNGTRSLGLDAGVTVTDTKVKFEENKALTFAISIVSNHKVEFRINDSIVSTHVSSKAALPHSATQLGVVCILFNVTERGLDQLSFHKFSLIH